MGGDKDLVRQEGIMGVCESHWCVCVFFWWFLVYREWVVPELMVGSREGGFIRRFFVVGTGGGWW